MKAISPSFILYKAAANLRSEATRTYLSILWWIAEPALLMFVYFFVFAIILKRFTEDFVPFLLIGLIGWQFFANTITNAAGSISSEWGLMQRVYVHKLTMPLITILTDSFKYLIVLLMLYLFLLLYGFRPVSGLIALPLVLISHLLLVAGLAIFLAGIVPLIPDLRVLISNFMRVGLYVSGVLYPISSVPIELQSYFYMNPMVGILESYRNIFMYNQPILFQELIYAGNIGIGFLSAGATLICSFDRKYPRLSVR